MALRKYYCAIIMIKFLPLYFLGLSHRTPRKIKNTVYHLQISAFVPGTFQFKNCEKYSNEMTDDVIHSNKCYIKYTNSAT